MSALPAAAPLRVPRLGFLGVGWIGLHRLKAIARDGAAEVAAIADPAAERAAAAAQAAPQAEVVDGLDALLERDLDGVVIATPSAQHAGQAEAALARGLAVFCQKPLGRNAAETARVVRAARRADRLLGVDLSYRHTVGMQRIRQRILSGGLGEVYAVEARFHNAYGPDKPWFYDRRLSGGGCLADLGVHLVDLSLWALDFPAVSGVTGSLLSGGRPLPSAAGAVEDYATARLDLATGATVSLACSWRLPAGRAAVIEAAFYGTHGGAAMRNVAGSFEHLRAEAYTGTQSCTLAEPPDDWGGRAAIDWARRLSRGEHHDPAAERLVDVARVLDDVYADALRPRRGRDDP